MGTDSTHLHSPCLGVQIDLSARPWALTVDLLGLRLGRTCSTCCGPCFVGHGLVVVITYVVSLHSRLYPCSTRRCECYLGHFVSLATVHLSFLHISSIAPFQTKSNPF